jgi:hypothetical protein
MRQIRPQRGVEILAEASHVREHYLVPDHQRFVYRLDVSTDGGRSWNEGQMEMILLRPE